VKFDATGDSSWAIIVTLLGYYVGSRIPNIDHYILVALGCVIILTVSPTLFQLARVIYKKYRANSSKS